MKLNTKTSLKRVICFVVVCLMLITNVPTTVLADIFAPGENQEVVFEVQETPEESYVGVEYDEYTTDNDDDDYAYEENDLYEDDVAYEDGLTLDAIPVDTFGEYNGVSQYDEIAPLSTTTLTNPTPAAFAAALANATPPNYVLHVTITANFNPSGTFTVPLGVTLIMDGPGMFNIGGVTLDVYGDVYILLDTLNPNANTVINLHGGGQFHVHANSITGNLPGVTIIPASQVHVIFSIGNGSLVSGSLSQFVYPGQPADVPVVEAPHGFHRDFTWSSSVTGMTPDFINGHVVFTAVFVPVDCSDCECGDEYCQVCPIPGCDECLYCGDCQEDCAHGYHNWINPVVTPPTCTDDGFTTYSCEFCPATNVVNLVPALGCDHEIITDTLPNCHDDGLWLVECSRCGDEVERVVRPALGCDHQIITDTEPDCHDDGLWLVACSRCDDEIERVIRPALGCDHVIISDTLPNCHDDGLWLVECSRCGDEVERVVRPALGCDLCYCNECLVCSECACPPIPTAYIVTVQPNPAELEPGDYVTITVYTQNMPDGAFINLNLWYPSVYLVDGPTFNIVDNQATITIRAHASAQPSIRPEGHSVTAETACGHAWWCNETILLDTYHFNILVVAPSHVCTPCPDCGECQDCSDCLTFRWDMFNNGPGGYRTRLHDGFATSGTIRMWAGFGAISPPPGSPGGNARLPIHVANTFTAYDQDGNCVRNLVTVNTTPWYNPIYFNFLDVNKNAPWQTITLTIRICGEYYSALLVNSRFFSLHLFNNGPLGTTPSTANESLAEAGLIRMWPYLNGVGSLIPMTFADSITAYLHDTDICVMDFVTVHQIWCDTNGWQPYFMSIDVDKNALPSWEFIDFSITVFGQTIEFLLHNANFVNANTVTFVVQVGASGVYATGGATTTVEVPHGTQIPEDAIPNYARRTGFYFVGWYLGEYPDWEPYHPGDYGNVYGNRTFTARFNNLYHYVNFEAGSGGELTFVAPHFNPIRIRDGLMFWPDRVPTPVADEGYAFVRWELNGEEVNPAGFRVINTAEQYSMELYFVAIFARTHYFVTFVVQNGAVGVYGAGTTATITVPSGQLIPTELIPNYTARTGFYFAGWYLGEYPDWVPYHPAYFGPVNEDLLFTARFNLLWHTITFEIGEGGAGSGRTQDVRDGMPINEGHLPSVEALPCWSFSHWYPENPVGIYPVGNMTFVAIFVTYCVDHCYYCGECLLCGNCLDFRLDIFNNGPLGCESRPNAHMEEVNAIRMWTGFGLRSPPAGEPGGNRAIPLSVADSITAVVRATGECADELGLITINRVWVDGQGFGNYFLSIDVCKDANWEFIDFTITVRDEIYDVVLHNENYVPATFWLESAEVTICNTSRHVSIFAHGTAVGAITHNHPNNDPEFNIAIRENNLWTPEGWMYGLVVSVNSGVTITESRTIVIEVSRNGITAELTINLYACVVEPPSPVIVSVTPNPAVLALCGEVTVTVVTEHMPNGAWIEFWLPEGVSVSDPEGRLYIEDNQVIFTLVATEDVLTITHGSTVTARVLGQWGATEMLRGYHWFDITVVDSDLCPELPCDCGICVECFVPCDVDCENDCVCKGFGYCDEPCACTCPTCAHCEDSGDCCVHCTPCVITCLVCNECDNCGNCAFTMLGDLNGDGFVTMADVELLWLYLEGQLPEGTTINRCNADINRDGSIDWADYLLLIAMVIASGDNNYTEWASFFLLAEAMIGSNSDIDLEGLVLQLEEIVDFDDDNNVEFANMLSTVLQ